MLNILSKYSEVKKDFRIPNKKVLEYIIDNKGLKKNDWKIQYFDRDSFDDSMGSSWYDKKNIQVHLMRKTKDGECKLTVKIRCKSLATFVSIKGWKPYDFGTYRDKKTDKVAGIIIETKKYIKEG